MGSMTPSGTYRPPRTEGGYWYFVHNLNNSFFGVFPFVLGLSLAFAYRLPAGASPERWQYRARTAHHFAETFRAFLGNHLAVAVRSSPFQA